MEDREALYASLPSFKSNPDTTVHHTKRWQGYAIACLKLIILFWVVKVLLPQKASSLSAFLGSQPEAQEIFDINAPDAITSIGEVKWWKCEEPDVLPGTDCGYIMYVFSDVYI